MSSLIAPLQFQGDYRPYYTIYEADFDVRLHPPDSCKELTSDFLDC